MMRMQYWSMRNRCRSHRMLLISFHPLLIDSDVDSNKTFLNVLVDFHTAENLLEMHGVQSCICIQLEKLYRSIST
jgi:hypothetical protein